jgi:hypothetical protein
MNFLKRISQALLIHGELLDQKIMVDDIEKRIVLKRRFLVGTRIFATEDWTDFPLSHHYAKEIERQQIESSEKFSGPS